MACSIRIKTMQLHHARLHAAPPIAARRRPLFLLQASTSGAEQFTSKAADAFSTFVKKHRPSVEEKIDDLQRSASRTWKNLDAEYELTEKAEASKRRLQETALDVDQTYGVRRRLRRAAEYLRRSVPVWSRAFEEFSSTPVGKVVVVSSFFLLLTTPFFWRVSWRMRKQHVVCLHDHPPCNENGVSCVHAFAFNTNATMQVLNGLILLWWLALPLASILAVQKAKKAAEAQAEAIRAEEARRRDPLGSMFRDAANSVKNAAYATPGGDGRKAGSSSSRRSEGPIIDAEWKPLDKS